MKLNLVKSLFTAVASRLGVYRRQPRAAFLAFSLVVLSVAQPQIVAAADGPAPVSQARRVVSGVHADAISFFAENGGLVLGTKADVDGGLGVRLDPQLTSYNVEESTRTTVPAAPSYDFLGLAGSDVWIAPETNPGGTALWPGFSTEGVPSGLVDGNQLTLRLESVTGPGTLHIYQTSAFGEPSRLLSSTGLVYRAWTIPRGTHAHANWAFSAAGKYTLTFSVEAVTNGVSLTATQNYAFIVGDVPATIATATTLAANTNSLVIGQPVILTAAVTPTNALGWVEFRDGTAVLGHEVVAGDSAALTTTNLALGARSVTARFVPQWLNDFSASTSAPVSITVTDESGVPFSITGVAASYQPGETLNAQVAGVTLAAGQSIQWRIRPAGFGGQGGIFTGTGSNAAAGSLTQRMDPSFDGYELIAFLRQGTTTLAQTPWVLITVHNAVEPLSIAYEGPSPAYVGDPTTAVVSGRALLNGESFVLVSRVVASRWSAIPQTLQTSERSFVVRPATSFNGKWAVQIVSNSLVVAQSAPIDVQILSREMFVEGVQGVYRPGQVLRATATVFPDPGALTYMWAFTDATATPLKQASDPEGRTLEQPITITDNGRRLLIVAFVDYGTHRGNAAQVVIPISVTALDPSIQLFFFSGLSDHYHQGYPINLNLVADPALADNDVLTWEWRWPNGDWAEFPGASGTHHSLIAEQALHDVQVRATVDFGQEGANPMTTPSLTIKVDDHGAPPSQQIAVTGVTNVIAGNLVTLTGSVSTASILTTYQWQKKPAGASEFTVIPNATSAQLTFTATILDDGAQYRASILKPNGTVGYGPSPTATLKVDPATPSNTLVPFARPTQHGGTIATEASLVVSADFTGDGKVDVVTAGNSSGSLSFLQGTGDGGFLAERGLNVGSAHRSWTLAAADFDKDGKVDLVTTEYSSTTGEIVHYKNDGTGNFTRQILATGLPLITRSRVGDLNGDGRPDIVYFKNSTTLVFQTGNASGGLDPESIVSSPSLQRPQRLHWPWRM
ncbi:MAG: choice-of-anchor M domain-containing protein [Verrucomicrobia bacterium]|nr:choice-of-anchor M domain-containing protein [Verrucomicrobiota bacterium]